MWDSAGKCIIIARRCVNSYNITAAAAKSVTHVSFRWCISGCKAKEVHMHHDGKRQFLRQRVRGSIQAVRADQNYSVFLMETGVVADAAHRLDYQICKMKYCWRSVDAHFHDRVIYMSCTVSHEKASTRLYINHCHITTNKLAKMQDVESLKLHWC